MFDLESDSIERFSRCGDAFSFHVLRVHEQRTEPTSQLGQYNKHGHQLSNANANFVGRRIVCS